MLKEYAREFLMIGHELSTANHKLLETELVDSTFYSVGDMHIRHKEAMAALKRAEFGSHMLPLGTLPKEIDRIIREHQDGSVVDRLKVALETIRFRFEVELQGRQFLYISPESAPFYEKKAAFGSGVEKAFPDAAEDIENAGSCLAVGQGTACVFHLMRAMEVAVRKLAKRLSITTHPKDTWGLLVGRMTPKIAAMPDNTAAKKRKKDTWSEAAMNLHHVGQATRNSTMHPKRTYTDQQAREVYDAVRVFMTGLAKL